MMHGQKNIKSHILCSITSHPHPPTHKKIVPLRGNVEKYDRARQAQVTV